MKVRMGDLVEPRVVDAPVRGYTDKVTAPCSRCGAVCMIHDDGGTARLLAGGALVVCFKCAGLR